METYLKELEEMQNELKLLSSQKELSELRDNLHKLNSIKARVNELIPKIQYLYNSQIGDVCSKYSDKSATVLKLMIESELKNEIRLSKMAERVSSSCNFIAKDLITIISSIKYEMQNQ